MGQRWDCEAKLMVSRPEKSLLAERRRLENKQYDLSVQIRLVNERIERIDASLAALRGAEDQT